MDAYGSANTARSIPRTFDCRAYKLRTVLLFLQLVVHDPDVRFRLIRVGSVPLVRGRDRILRCRLVDALTGLQLGLHPGEECLVEVGVLLEIVPGHGGAVAGDDRVDVLDGGGGLCQGVSDGDTAAAVVRVEQRRSLPGENV